MKVRSILKYLLAAILFSGAVSCRNPLKDFNLQISTEVIKHTAVVRILDVDGVVVPNSAVSLVSGQTEDIYNMEGTKDYKVNDGIVIFGLDPNVPMDDNTMIRFRIEVTAPGYVKQTVPVTITNSSGGITIVTMTKPGPISEGGGVKEVLTNVDLATDGSTVAATSVTVPALNPGERQLSLNIPAGTQFKDANGNIIVGGALMVSVGSFDPDNESIDALLPGGGLAVDAVVMENGSEAAGTFSAAGIARISMMINGVEIKEFTQPISVSVPLSANYISPITGSLISAGQPFAVFSNSSQDNKWRYERTVNVSGSAIAGYSANFTISHLSDYLSGEFQEACSNGIRINFSGSWMSNSSTYPLSILIEMNGRRIYSKTHSVSLRSSSIVIPSIPAKGVVLTVKNALTGQAIQTSVIADCGQVTAVILPDPSPPTATTSTLQLYVRCPNRTGVITLLPTFELFYRESTTTRFVYLGTVVNGLLRTSLLKTDGTKYDFQAFYNNRVKVVLDKTVSTDNTATVGIQPGDIIGEKVGATNLAILTEECNKL